MHFKNAARVFQQGALEKDVRKEIVHSPNDADVLGTMGITGLALFQFFYSCTPYGDWLIHSSINGGPLGPLSWVFILLMGTFAADCIFSMQRKRMLFYFIVLAVKAATIATVRLRVTQSGGMATSSKPWFTK